MTAGLVVTGAGAVTAGAGAVTAGAGVVTAGVSEVVPLFVSQFRNALRCGHTCGEMRIGIQTSGALPTLSPKKPLGATPTIGRFLYESPTAKGIAMRTSARIDGLRRRFSYTLYEIFPGLLSM